MAGSWNSITLTGNLGRDPELRTTNSGAQVATFPVATTERRGGDDLTTWFNVSCFGKLAETAAQYLTKGSYVLVQGPLTMRTFQKRDNTTGVSLDINAREMRMLDRRTQSDDYAGPRASAAGNDEDAPF